MSIRSIIQSVRFNVRGLVNRQIDKAVHRWVMSIVEANAQERAVRIVADMKRHVQDRAEMFEQACACYKLAVEDFRQTIKAEISRVEVAADLAADNLRRSLGQTDHEVTCHIDALDKIEENLKTINTTLKAEVAARDALQSKVDGIEVALDALDDRVRSIEDDGDVVHTDGLADAVREEIRDFDFSDIIDTALENVTDWEDKIDLDSEIKRILSDMTFKVDAADEPGNGQKGDNDESN